MPDTAVRTQAWQAYGACSPLSASSYFRQIVNYSDDIKLPNELSTGNSYTVSKSSFTRQLMRLNKGLTSSNFDLICQASDRRQAILTNIHICYENGKYGKCNSPINNCGRKFIISGGR